MRRILIAALLALLSAGHVFAQATATPTGTPTLTATPTDTPTETPTATPTMVRHLALALQETCGSTPCALPAVPAGGGTKSIAVETHTGTATVLAMCRVPGFGAWLPVEYQLASLTGATCTTPANCRVVFTDWCDEVFLKITACSSCSVSGYLRIDQTGR